MPTMTKRSKKKQMIAFNIAHPPGTQMRLKKTRSADPEHDPVVTIKGEAWVNHDSVFVALQEYTRAVSVEQLYSMDN